MNNDIEDKGRRDSSHEGGNSMNITIKRPCTILESIEDSFKQIKDVEKGKSKFKSLNESRALWKQWAEEIEDDPTDK